MKAGMRKEVIAMADKSKKEPKATTSCGCGCLPVKK